ncbi:NADPH nitrite reductase [Mrakia frigida]|uniref:NADPH nitrite reductase n=1 Tax=Mrakia frigida TaxID=29902 RepID=UPI003FCC12F1
MSPIADPPPPATATSFSHPPTDEGAGSSSPPKTRIFVVGLGMVGIAFIEKVLASDVDGRYKIITCGEERHLAYNRVGLTEFFEHRNVSSLYLQSPEWYHAHEQGRFEFYVGQQVVLIDHEKKIAHTDTGHQYEFDICVIATGSDAGMPPYCSFDRGKKTKGVFVYRNISDLETIIEYGGLPHIKTATVVGGGLLGLEAAKALYDMHEIEDVSIINRTGYPLSRQLDASAGEMVLRRIEALGVKVHTNVNVKDMLIEKDEDGGDVFKGFEFDDGEVVEADLVIMAVGITPRDDLARNSGIKVHPRGGIDVDDSLMTSAKDIYAMGECASWRGHTYGLIAPGVEMADILCFNLCQTQTNLGSFKPRKMNNPDLSTKLKLMGVDVASFGNFFADITVNKPTRPLVETVPRARTAAPRIELELDDTTTESKPSSSAPVVLEVISSREDGKKVKQAVAKKEEEIKSLVFQDPVAGTYKKYLFSKDGKYLLGGMMVGDVSDFVKLVAITKKKKALDVDPATFIVGAKSGEDDGADLDDDTQVCSCHNVTKGQIAACIKSGEAKDFAGVKKCTKAGAGCGGCIPLVTNIFKAEMKKAGLSVSNNICSHFAMSRADLFHIVKIKKLKTFDEVLADCGVRKNALGCEVCRPCVGSIISSTVGINAHVMDAVHFPNQETNDKFLANIQRDGTYSVVPRMAAGEVTADGLIAVGQVAKKWNLYTKITGGQRVDLFGAQRHDLPDIWAELVAAGFESGHAYGKSLRTVKSCVGSSWCRYGIGDSVGLAVQLETRYKGVRSPHKFKGGVSGCVRECAEAQSKDFGLIATDKGWNIYIAGNGGAVPKHGLLFASDVPPSKVIQILDRYLMYYIYTADRLQRTARWIETFDGGVEKLRRIILDDELGICAELEKSMNELVGTYECEWTRVVNEPERRKQFKQFANTDENAAPIVERKIERNQPAIAEWPKDFPAVKLNKSDIHTPVAEWQWSKVASRSHLMPSSEGTTSVSVLVGDTQLAIWDVPGRGLYAAQQMCPHKRSQTLSYGVVGDDENGRVFVACPLHKRQYALDDGDCLNDNDYSIITFDAKEEDGDLYIRLPPVDELDAVLGTSKWMVTQATSEALGRGAATKILEIVGPEDEGSAHGHGGAEAPSGDSCGGGGGGKLAW